jgi:hypothetical protein
MTGRTAYCRDAVGILGAGASYDSVESPAGRDGATRPPLAQQLFEDRFGDALQHFPAMLPLVGRLRRQVRTGSSVEAELSKLRNEAETYPKRYPQLLATQFYLREIVQNTTMRWSSQAHGVTHHQTLVDLIEQWRLSRSERVCYVSFNYDTLLEDAIETVHHLKINSFDAYRHPAFQVVKPHGSINWSRRANASPTDLQDGWSQYLFRAEHEIQSSLVFGAPDSHVFEDSNGYGTLPAIALPLDTKRAFECPPDHMEDLRKAVSEADRILTIGWRAFEPHFADLWKDRSDDGQLFIVAGSEGEAQDAFDNMRSMGMLLYGRTRPSPIQTVWGGSGFGPFIESGAIENFLG